MRYEVRVEVRHKAGVADPQGATIERALPTLGYSGVSHVTVGKSIRFEVDAATDDEAQAVVEDLCARFLTNPVIEDADIHVARAAEVPA